MKNSNHSNLRGTKFVTHQGLVVEISPFFSGDIFFWRVFFFPWCSQFDVPAA